MQKRRESNMKKNQNTLPKPSLALPTFNRCLNLMVLALIVILAGVVKSEAETRAIMGRAIIVFPSDLVCYLTQEQYQSLVGTTSADWVHLESLGVFARKQGSNVLAYDPKHPSRQNLQISVNAMTLTNNGLRIKNSYYNNTSNGYIAGSAYHGGNTFLFIDLNELSVNRAMAAAPIGTLKVTPSNKASEQTKVQWSVE
jgi:hypothetical protein